MTTGTLINPFSVMKYIRPELSGRIAYFGGGGGSAPSNQTITQSNIPEYAEPYFMAMMDDATRMSSAQYTPYPEQRLADQSDQTIQSYNMTQNVADNRIPLYDAAVAGTQGAMQGAAGIATNLQEDANYDPFQYRDPRMWPDEGVAQQYMSPYTENVLDLQKERAIQDFSRQQQYRDAEATKAGAFGGSRQAVQDALAQEALGMNMAEIDARGLDRAYLTGNDMFNKDRDIRYDYDKAQAGENYNAAGFGRDAYDTALNAWGMTGDLSNSLLGMGEADRAAYIQAAQLMDASGGQQAAYNQAAMDIGYQDFLSQRDWDQDQLSWYSDMLRGVPISPDTTQTNYTADNPLQDFMGAGIASIGMANA